MVYGVNTGFGNFADVVIPGARLQELQLNLVRSHAAGVGEPLDEAETRALMVLRANCLAKGHSGIRPETLDLLLAMINRRVHPVVPRRAAWGRAATWPPRDLALVLVGEGPAPPRRCRPRARRRSCRRALARRAAGQDGLALINGTQLMSAPRAWRGGGLQAGARRRRVGPSHRRPEGDGRGLRPRIQAARPHAARRLRAHLRKLLAGSAIRESHATAGSAAPTPSLHPAGARRGTRALAFARRTVEIEINAGTDNPMSSPTPQSPLGRQLHGAPVALAADLLAIAAAQMAGISEGGSSGCEPRALGPPAFLARDGACSPGSCSRT